MCVHHKYPYASTRWQNFAHSGDLELAIGSYGSYANHRVSGAHARVRGKPLSTSRELERRYAKRFRHYRHTQSVMRCAMPKQPQTLRPTATEFARRAQPRSAEPYALSNFLNRRVCGFLQGHNCSAHAARSATRFSSSSSSSSERASRAFASDANRKWRTGATLTSISVRSRHRCARARCEKNVLFVAWSRSQRAKVPPQHRIQFAIALHICREAGAHIQLLFSVGFYTLACVSDCALYCINV